MVGKYIFYFNIGASLLNFLIAVMARTKTKSKEFNDLIFYWASVIFTFIMAAIFINTPTEIAFSFFFQVFSINLMARMLCISQGMPYPWKLCASLQIPGMLLTSYFLLYTDLGFTLSLMPVVLTFSVSFVIPIWRVLVTDPQNSNWIAKTLAFFYITAIIHIFNFAIFRLDPTAALWGWSISIAQYQCISVFLPLMIYHSRDMKEKMNLQLALEHISGLRNLDINSSSLKKGNINIEELYHQLEMQITQKEEVLKQLKMANDSLEEEREINEILIKTISHDLATPLTVINAYTEMLSTNRIVESDIPKTWGRLKHNIDSSLNMIARIRNAILTRSQVNLVQVHNVCVDRSIKKVMELFESRFKEKNLTCHYSNSTSLDVFVLAEETTLVEHVLSNILSNAIKFSKPNNEIILNVFDAQECVNIEIRDFGVGIEEHRLAKKLLLSTEGTSGEIGSGFGMMVMSYFLKKFGGSIDIKSQTDEENHGTTVTVSLKKANQRKRSITDSANINSNFMVTEIKET